ncbi:MAG TPA: phosphoribosylformylglycinamidine synthase [Rhodospirillaceae bacterium]|nr:phosphoribosylformylglycinamidine synthase [Rhodospirillaceae bacterium]
MPRIEILSHEDDGRARQIEQALGRRGKTAAVRVVDVYTSENPKAQSPEFIDSLTNPVTQKAGTSYDQFDWALEIGYLPGVTDNIGHTASELLALTTHCIPRENGDLDATSKDPRFRGEDSAGVYSSRLYLIKGKLNRGDVEALGHELSNKLIQRATIKSRDEFVKDGGMSVVIPKVTLGNKGAVADNVDLNVSDEELKTIGAQGIKNPDGSRRGPLGMSLLYMQAVRDYFKKEGRPAKDIELETLAQTWSEHCKHTIFASPIDDIKEGIYRHYIKRATQEIRKKRGKNDICVSVFSDNAGGIIFDDEYLITDKVETHNSPSALDPFGGAITGIVGVNRDCVGFGRGAKPVINRYGFCLADPRTKPEYYRDKAKANPILSPETIMNGVVRGVEAGGNCSGIPTPQGFVYFDDRFVGKPLVFVGTIGLIPREINGKPGHKKGAKPGDKIVMVGGRVGRDGIHGATFSSVALDEGSPATAVQIGDPITQKKFSDAIVKEIRGYDWYNAITDNGAGGLSSSVGEMGDQSGGFHVELDKVPLKYPGMAPWEIWISESQERMTLSVPPENTDKLIAFLARRGVEATVIGTYTDTGRALITWHGETVMDLDMDFLHDGLPETPLKTVYVAGGEDEPDIAQPKDYADTVLNMLSRLNICSKEFISTQYDHEVQAGSVLKPLQGPGRVYAEASVTKPVLTSSRGVVLSQGLAPRYSDIDTGAMAAAALDMAVRNAVTAGVDFNHLAILDNFCWCSSDEPERLGQLKRAAAAIYDLAVLYETPFISGKDSMFNDFKGYDAQGKEVKISAPPTLLVSSIGVIPDIEQSISLAPKMQGDLVYLLGETKDELGASEYYDMNGALGQNVPRVNGAKNLELYKLYSAVARNRLIASAMPINLGGLGVALAKKAIASQLGMEIDLSGFALRPDKLLFSESLGRILVTVAPNNQKAFEKHFGSFANQIGLITNENKLNIKNILSVEIKKLDEYYKQPLKDY